MVYTKPSRPYLDPPTKLGWRPNPKAFKPNPVRDSIISCMVVDIQYSQTTFKWEMIASLLIYSWSTCTGPGPMETWFQTRSRIYKLSTLSSALSTLSMYNIYSLQYYTISYPGGRLGTVSLVSIPASPTTSLSSTEAAATSFAFIALDTYLSMLT